MFSIGFELYWILNDFGNYFLCHLISTELGSSFLGTNGSKINYHVPLLQTPNDFDSILTRTTPFRWSFLALNLVHESSISYV